MVQEHTSLGFKQFKSFIIEPSSFEMLDTRFFTVSSETP